MDEGLQLFLQSTTPWEFQIANWLGANGVSEMGGESQRRMQMYQAIAADRLSI